jgi:hypothetical protein
VGALSHYLETSGIPTIGISLIRLHTETIRPPRALWVPFELGRPLGRPSQPEDQRRLLRKALSLLERTDVPILEGWEAVPVEEDAGDLHGLACFVPTPAKTLRSEVMDELARLRSRLESEKAAGPGLAAGVLGIAPEEAAKLVLDFIDEVPAENPRPELPYPHVLKLAVDDLVKFYNSVGADETDSAERLREWFWRETAMGRAAGDLRARMLEHPDPTYRAVAYLVLTPFTEAERPVEVSGVMEAFPHLMPSL